MPVLVNTKFGLYCPDGDFYIDPNRAVDHALITHAHADHARRGSRNYYCVKSSVGLLKCRLGERINVRGHVYGEQIRFGNVWVSFHPAGHILGSAQIRIESGTEVWVVSGDYKREHDPTCEPFEVVPCDVFVTEATFGTPAFRWERDQNLGKQIHDWWMNNQAQGRNSLLFGYSLGKAQRILGELHGLTAGPVLIHNTIAPLTHCYREEGVRLAPTLTLDELEEDRELVGELILAPPSIEKSVQWMNRLGDYETAFASGWMQKANSGYGWGRNYDKGFVMSDHADWDALLETIHQTGASKVYVQHRGLGALVKELRRRNIEAHPAEKLECT